MYLGSNGIITLREVAGKYCYCPEGGLELEQQTFYNAAIYCRLSKDDINLNESSSIQTQKAMLTKYVQDNGWRVVSYYVDDGISGTTFERDGFKRMLEDIEDGKINMVITKDLSRLGRDYLKTGYYTECYFPENDVRYIALNDGIDTINSDNDIAPFKNVLNEMIAKDLSKKIKSAFRVKFANGEYHGTFAPFGYAKDPENKGRLIIDPESAQAVRLVYDLARQGYGAMRIRTTLTEMKVLTPSAYLHKVNPKNYAKLYDNAAEHVFYSWSTGQVERILDNEIYIGNMIHHKEIQVSFKDRRRQRQPREKWHRVKGTHEPIIEPELWYMLRERFQHRGGVTRKYPKNVFARIARCADCGRSMWLTPCQYDSHLQKMTERRYLHCSTNRTYRSKHMCATHTINYSKLCELVLNDVHQYAALALENPDNLLTDLSDMENKQRQKNLKRLKDEHKSSSDRLCELSSLLQKLFEENATGRMSDANYEMLFRKYQDEQESLAPLVEELSDRLKVLDEAKDNSRKWIDLIAKYRDLKELDAEIVNELIEKIVIHQAEKIEGKRTQKVEIFYRFVGQIPA